MTKRYSILRNKLEELEAQLIAVLSLQADQLTPCHQLHSQDIEQRLAFMRTLLLTEIASHPSKPRHLKHMSRRLTKIEDIFRDWNNFTLTSEAHDHQYHVHDDHGDALSTCSCTESCLNDDGQVEAEDAADGLTGSPSLSSPRRYEDPEGSFYVVEDWVEDFKELPVVVFTADQENNYYEGIKEEKEKVIFKDRDDHVMVKRSSSLPSEVGRKSGSGVGMTCGAVFTGWVLGMVSMGMVMMVGLSSAGSPFQCGSQQYGNFLNPT